jgi:uncharacterized protein DUF3187
MLRMSGRLPLLLASALLLPVPAFPQTAYPRRGPLPARDEWMLAQPLLTLPATDPDPLGAGHVEARVDGDWGSDFGLVGPGIDPASDPDYVVDGEHRSAALTLRRGFSDRVTVGLRVPLYWRGPGILDHVIDAWHRWFGFPDSGRSLVPDDQFRVEGRDVHGHELDWSGRPGTGLGNVELDGHCLVLGLADPRAWRLAAVGRLSLPTATGTYAHAGAAGGLQLVAAHGLGERADFYLGLGTSVSGKDEFQGIAYERVRGQGFLALEGRVTHGWSLVAQLETATRLATSIQSYPGTTLYLRVGSKFGLSPAWMAELGITEGLVNQDAMTDFGFLFALGRRF